MRTRNASGASAQANFLTTFHDVAFLYFEFRKVKKQGKQSLAVVDDDAVTLVIEEACQQHGAIIECRDRGSSGDAVIEALMLALGNSVEDTLGTEDVGRGGVDRCGEVAAPFALGGDATQIFLLYFLGFFDLLELFGAGLCEFLFDRKLDFDLRVDRRSDGELAGEGERRVACCATTTKFKSVAARGGFEAHASEGEPCFGRWIEAEG